MSCALIVGLVACIGTRSHSLHAIGAIVLHLDVEGIPAGLLIEHLAGDGQIVYCLPHLATSVGICMTAAAYGIDIGERGGCPFLIFGLLAAPLFVMAIFALWLYCRRRRIKLFDSPKSESISVGVSYIATWTDRMSFRKIDVAADPTQCINGA